MAQACTRRFQRENMPETLLCAEHGDIKGRQGKQPPRASNAQNGDAELPPGLITAAFFQDKCAPIHRSAAGMASLWKYGWVR